MDKTPAMVAREAAAVTQVAAAFLVLIDDTHRVTYTQDGEWLRKFNESDPGPSSIWLSESERRKAETSGLLSLVVWQLAPISRHN